MSGLSFSVRADLFRVAARFAAREFAVIDPHPTLAGVHLEPTGKPSRAGIVLSACNGLVALYLHDADGRTSRAATMQRPDVALETVRDAARRRDVVDGAARIVFHEGHCAIDDDPEAALLISEIGAPRDFPSFRTHIPARALRAAVDMPADVAELLAVAARQLARAAGDDIDTARLARFATYRNSFEPEPSRHFTFVRFSAWDEAFALIAPEGASVASPAWLAPDWLLPQLERTA